VKLVQIGAGNIGRSFIGQLFSKAGWDVVFIDIDTKIIDELNKRNEYRVVIKDKNPETIIVKNVRGVNAVNLENVVEEIATADLVSTAVGKKTLPNIMKPIALGLIKRKEIYPDKPLDIIICENMKDAASFFEKSLKKYLPDNYPFEKLLGLVETSIGKMVPIMSEKDKQKDPLLVYAEAYNTLIVDKKGFKGPIPDIPEIEAKENMKAWVDRKLFIHNLGHAVLAYISFAFEKGYTYVWEAAEDKEIYEATKFAMWESGNALILEYPSDFNKKNMSLHIDDLLDRFKNRSLGDTLYRVGRDLYRKLSPDDRLVGAVKICGEHHIYPSFILLGIVSAFFFKATDEKGRMFENDTKFFKELKTKGLKKMIADVCGFHEEGLVLFIEDLYRKIEKKIALKTLMFYLMDFTK